MPESLASLLAEDLSRSGVESSTVLRCTGFAEARLLAEPAALTMLAVPCRETVNDGYGGFFVWNEASTAADDNANTLKIADVDTGRWVRLGDSLASEGSFVATYATLYRDASAVTFPMDAAFHDLSDWGGSNVTATGVTASTSTGIFTAETTGKYSFIVNINPQLSSSGSEQIELRVCKNGVGMGGLLAFTPGAGGLTVCDTVDLAAGDTLKSQIKAAVSVKTLTVPYGTFKIERIA